MDRGLVLLGLLQSGQEVSLVSPLDPNTPWLNRWSPLLPLGIGLTLDCMEALASKALFSDLVGVLDYYPRVTTLATSGTSPLDQAQ